jgi:hypothetical protein
VSSAFAIEDVLLRRVADEMRVRPGEATFYFHYRGPSSQHTWEWVNSLKVGERRVLPRMPMVPIREPTVKKILLSPLRGTGALIQGVGHLTMGMGKGMKWVGKKVGCKRGEKGKWISQVEWEDRMREVEALRKQGTVRKDSGIRGDDTKVGEFSVYNERGEKTWTDVDGDAESTIAGSEVDEKAGKEWV